MIKFFRKIRRNLLSDGKTGKYFKYATGEILLVVIGILIALSINNWNEDRKNRLKEAVYLEGIKTDLEWDIKYLDFLIPFNNTRIKEYASLDSVVKLRSDKIFEIEFSEIFDLSDQTGTFYPRSGAYSSLINENSAGLIQNRELLANIKFLYDIEYVRASLLGQELDDISTKIRWERRLDFRQELEDYNFEDYDSLFADLGELNRNINKFLKRINGLKKKINEVVEKIDIELDKK
ncbi:DUF6090 family protein [Winogradskyella alexanderae]|uniref:Uncharacterized protein n=1 Tax=Winogradskyella alexanderae TaxID=2877123 RepID=A0ABS7XV88_9FLAO|nr:DUF6090 family protein [Winogradskyella alexanderae]MCA0133933.1 hypothetical protein [Winogradskyella alexanderae]